MVAYCQAFSIRWSSFNGIDFIASHSCIILCLHREASCGDGKPDILIAHTRNIIKSIFRKCTVRNVIGYWWVCYIVYRTSYSWRADILYRYENIKRFRISFVCLFVYKIFFFVCANEVSTCWKRHCVAQHENIVFHFLRLVVRLSFISHLNIATGYVKSTQRMYPCFLFSCLVFSSRLKCKCIESLSIAIRC